MYLDANNLYELTMSQKPPVNDFEWKENIGKFNEDLLFNLRSDLPFLPEKEKIQKCKKPVCTIQDKKTMLCI